MIEAYKDIQPKVVNILNNSYKKNRFSHAYIYEGPKGTSKFKIALETAKLIMCPNGLCNNCRTCKQIDALSYPNLIVVSPEGQSVKKEQIKNLISELNKTSLVEGPRVYIINHIDKMTISAANSLLKYFEEPHPDIHAILITENIGQILKTIISRAQVITFSKASTEQIKQELLLKGFKEEHASIAPLVTNNLLEAEKLCESEDFSLMLDIIYEIGNIIANKYHNALLYFREHATMIQRKNVDLFLDLLTYYYKDILNYQMDIPLNFPFDKSLKILRNIDQEEVIENLKFILQSRADLKYNPNIDLLMDRILLKLDWR